MEAYTVVAALDFGNSFSGYAFSNKSEFETDPLKIRINPPWKCDTKKRTSTCILFDPEKKFVSFGYNAETEYARAAKQKTEKSYFFFKQFRSTLFSRDEISKDTELMDVAGNRLCAGSVFILFIKALVENCKANIKKSYENIKDDEIRWLITVPADLTGTAEDFMKSCAIEAGIPQNQLGLVTDAEAAFAYCQILLEGDRYSKLEDSTEYMIVDLGGCAADIRVVKKVGGEIREKYRKSRNCNVRPSDVLSPCLAFLENVTSVAGIEVLQKNQSIFLSIERRLEEAKLSSRGTEISVKHCKPIRAELKKLPTRTDAQYGFKVERSYIVFSKQTVTEIFKNRIDAVISEIEMVFKAYREATKISYIVMTGDFYECCLVHKMVESKFTQKHIIFSDSNEEAAMKGAVFCGWQSYRHTHELLRAYDKPVDQKGFVLVINFLFPDAKNERKGSLEDVKNLKAFFTNLKYEVRCLTEDMSSKALKKELEDLKNEVLTENSHTYHSFICVIMSHGNQTGIKTTDGSITVEELIIPFKNDKAKSFIGKPKLFLIQSCRGRDEQQLIKNENATEENAVDYSAVLRMPRDADMILIYATTPGCISKRRTKSTKWTGAWFIHAFIYVAEKYPNHHLLEILTAVTYELANNPEYVFGDGKKCQLSVFEVTLSKLFYL